MNAREPVVYYHIERNGSFMCFDRHGQDCEFWSDFGSPFVCGWDTAAEATAHAGEGDQIRVSVDGMLV